MDHQDHLGPTPSAGAGGGGGSGVRWQPHGRLLTACLVALNVFLVLLVYAYFWRFFSRARGGGGGGGGVDGEAASSSSSAASSPPASPKARDRREVERAITALPVFVARPSSSSSGGGGAAAAECSICIAELADGEEGRLLPRCGHRFHARCVDAWFRFHTTCPLCRATVLAADADPGAAEPAATTTGQPSRPAHGTDLSTDAVSDSPV